MAKKTLLTLCSIYHDFNHATNHDLNYSCKLVVFHLGEESAKVSYGRFEHMSARMKVYEWFLQV